MPLPEPKNPLNDASTLIKVAEYMSMAKPIVAFDLAETRYTAGRSAAYAAPNDRRASRLPSTACSTIRFDARAWAPSGAPASSATSPGSIRAPRSTTRTATSSTAASRERRLARGNVRRCGARLLPRALSPRREAAAPPSRDRPSRGRSHRLVWREGGSPTRSLFWPAAAAVGAPARHRLGDVTVFAGVAQDDASAQWLARLGGRWSRLAALRDRDGAATASLQVDGDGQRLPALRPRAGGGAAADRGLPHRRPFGREGHGTQGRGETYYAARRVLPRPAQIALRRRLTVVQSRVAFPAWPVESSLHDLYDLVLGLLAHLAQTPVPYVAPWPAAARGRSS
jgi:hypothetical protein